VYTPALKPLALAMHDAQSGSPTPGIKDIISELNECKLALTEMTVEFLT